MGVQLSRRRKLTISGDESHHHRHGQQKVHTKYPIADTKENVVSIHVHKVDSEGNEDQSRKPDSQTSNVHDAKSKESFAVLNHSVHQDNGEHSSKQRPSNEKQLALPETDPVQTSHGGSYTGKHRSASSAQAIQIVRDCWQKIDTSVKQDLEKRISEEIKVPKKGWKVIRLFVSSTFNDFYAERELLVKKVVPELKDWCESRKLHFIECDLRWGIPKDTNTEDTVSICLDELERCKRETDGKPFFLSLLGERYGWIPDDSCMSPDIKDRYTWIYPLSITHMEIVYGALRTQTPNAAFFLRDPTFLSELPAKFSNLFVDDSTLPREHMKRLKSELGKRYPSQVFDYKCRCGGTASSNGVEKVVIKDLENELAPKMVEFFKDAISKYQPDLEDIEETQWEVFKSAQDTFIEMRALLVIGRDDELQQAVTFVDVPLKFTETEDRSENGDPMLLLVVAEPGMGKSSLLAKIVLTIQENRSRRCIYNFASVGIGSTDVIHVLERFTSILRNLLGEAEPTSPNIEYPHIVKEFHELLSRFSDSRPNEQLVLVLDAVNQLKAIRGSKIDWLPLECQHSIRIIVSCVEGEDANSFRKMYEGKFQEIQLKTFDRSSGRQLVEARLGRYNKKLDSDQLEALISSSGAVNPLWLSLACEELRVYGVFETVNEKIASLPDNIDGMLETIIRRLVAEDETGLVKDVLILLQCSKNGLTETDIRTIMSQDGGPLPMMHWARCKRQLKFILLNTGSRRDEETLSFFHNSVGLAVNRIFLTDNDSVGKEYHLKLADYYQNTCKDTARVILELPMHLQYARELKRLYHFLRMDERSVGMNIISKQYYYQLMRCQLRHIGVKDQFASLIYFCHMCAVGRRAFSFQPHQNKDTCCVCGNFVAFKKDNALAFVCNKHKPFVAPGTSKCFVCQKVVFLQQKIPSAMPERVYLCPLCSNANRCVKIDV